MKLKIWGQCTCGTMDELGGSNNGSLPNRRRMATRSPTLVGRKEQEVDLVFFFLLFEDCLQDEEEILEAWLPISARCCYIVDMRGFENIMHKYSLF